MHNELLISNKKTDKLDDDEKMRELYDNLFPSCAIKRKKWVSEVIGG